MMSKSGEIRRDEGCFDYAGQFVMIYPCHGMKGNQEWLYGPVSMVTTPSREVWEALTFVVHRCNVL